MTTGVRTIGSELGSYYASKTWNGTNGKWSDSSKRFLNWNPYSMTFKQARQQPGRGYSPYTTIEWMGVLWGPQNVAWSSNDTLAALGKLTDSIKQHSFNMGVALGESKQTYELMVGTVHRITSSIRQLRRGRIDLAVRALGASPRGTHNRSQLQGPQGRRIQDPRALRPSDVSAMFLEVRYGWQPLLKDVYEAHKALVAHTARPRTSIHVITMKKDWAPYRYGGKYGGNQYAQWEINSSTSRQIKAILTETLSTPRAMGLTDPLSVAWELTPFSFVADWFIPIGTYLEALNSVPFISGKFLTSDYTTSTTTGTGLKDPYVNASCMANTVSVTRSVSSSLAVPMPSFKSIDKALSPIHIQNALALLHQMVAPKLDSSIRSSTLQRRSIVNETRGILKSKFNQIRRLV